MNPLDETHEEERLRRQKLAGLKFSLTKSDGVAHDFEFVAGEMLSTILRMNGEDFIYWSGPAPEFRVIAALSERGFSREDMELFWDAARGASPNFVRWAH